MKSSTIIPADLRALFGYPSWPLRVALLLAVLLLPCRAARAQVSGNRTAVLTDSTSSSAGTLDLDVLSIALEYVPSPGLGSFFEQYAMLGGKVNSLDPFIMPTATFRLASHGPVRIVLTGSYAYGSFNDVFGLRDTSETTGGTASLVEQFDAIAVPLMGGIEYTPVAAQFSSYVGAVGGLAVNNVTWTTNVRDQTFSLFYRPMTNLKGLGISPAFRIYAGIDLRFDGYFSERSPFRGIFLEGSYLALPVRRNYFAAVRLGGKGLPTVPSEDGATMNLGGLTLTLGLNLQFVRR